MRAPAICWRARAVVSEHGGKFPHSAEGLQALPGIGPYTAAAIAAIAFGARAVVVDANVERVIARVAAISTPLPAAKKEIVAACDSLTPATRAGDFAQAMMDLGAAICTVRTPDCPQCPLHKLCKAAQMKKPEAFPVRLPKKLRPERTGFLFWLENPQGQVWTITRPAKGLLGGMCALPTSDWHVAGDFDEQKARRQAPIQGTWHPTDMVIRHIFTHFALELKIWRATSAIAPETEGQWIARKRLSEMGMPSLFQKAIAAIDANS